MTLAKAQRTPRRRIKKVFFAGLASWREKLLAYCVLTTRSTDRQPRPGPDYMIPNNLLMLKPTCHHMV